MKNLFVLTMALYAAALSLSAQPFKCENSRSLYGINVVVLTLTGNTGIQASANDDVRIRSYLSSRGKVWGWKFPSERPAFAISEKVSHDTVFYKTPGKYTPGVIGINTYSEHIENSILIPRDKIIVIRKAESVRIEDEFKQVTLSGTDQAELTIRKSTVSNMKCHAQQKLKINGAETSGDYEILGTGASSYLLIANQVTVNFK